MIVFDEFPTVSLLDSHGRIDRGRFPNFADLARHSTWYSNATTVHDRTYAAVPAIMDGLMPGAERAEPSAKEHPNSIFRLLHRQGYRIRAVEEDTRVCPYRWCRRHRLRKPGYPRVRGRRRRVLQSIARIRPRRGAVFYFHHSLLAHSPWEYLPGCRGLGFTRSDFPDKLRDEVGNRDPYLGEHLQERHLLQVGCTDWLVGKLLGRLRREGLFKRAAIVITADHGISFAPDRVFRRDITSAHAGEVAPVPLFIKAPGQTRGRVDRSWIRTIDVLPTLAKLLRIRVPWQLDGHPAGSRAVRARREVEVRGATTGVFRMSATELVRRRRAALGRRLAYFGAGSWARVFRFGPHHELLGRTPAEVGVDPPGPLTAVIEKGPGLRPYRRDSRVAPLWISGWIEGGAPGAQRDLAIAVNSRIAAVARSIQLVGDHRERELISVLVPEETLREGLNSVRVYELSGGRLRDLTK